MVYIVLDSIEESRDELDSRVIDVAVAGIREDMRVLCMLTEIQEQFFKYMVGKADEPLGIEFSEQYQVAKAFLEAADGFPVVQTFDELHFPAIKIAQKICEERDRIVAQYGRRRPRSRRRRQ